jgi:hypothetical protein
MMAIPVMPVIDVANLKNPVSLNIWGLSIVSKKYNIKRRLSVAKTE